MFEQELFECVDDGLVQLATDLQRGIGVFQHLTDAEPEGEQVGTDRRNQITNPGDVREHSATDVARTEQDTVLATLEHQGLLLVWRERGSCGLRVVGPATENLLQCLLDFVAQSRADFGGRVDVIEQLPNRHRSRVATCGRSEQ